MTAALAHSLPAPVPTYRPPRLRPAPRREPPFDDELPAGNRPVAAWAVRLPFEEPRPAARPRRCAVSGPHPDPARWTRRLLIGLTESAAGQRPLTQVATLLTPSIAAALGRDLDPRAHGGRPHWLATARLRSVRATQPAEDVAELSATLQSGPRIRAVALRLEVRRGCWRCTRLQLG